MATKKKVDVKVDAVNEANVEAEIKDAKPKKEAAPKIEILRGRMPLVIVAMIKSSDEALTDSALAAKFRTTVGKISDVRHNRNFGYVTDAFKPDADMIEKAVTYAKQLDDKTVAQEIESMELASETEMATFLEARKASRPGRKKKVVEEAPDAEVTDSELEELSA